MVPLTQEQAIQIVQVVRDFHDETAQFLNNYGHQPLRNSKGDLELMSFPRPKSIETALAQGSLLIEFVADQAFAFTKTMIEPVQTIAPWTCVRALIEASAHACWLFDPGVDAHTRVQRSFALRYEGLSQQIKFAKVGGSNEDLEKAISRIDAVEEVAVELGYKKIANKKGERTGIGQKYSSATDIIKTMLNEEANYRLLSAAVHAHHWAIQRLGFRVAENTYGGFLLEKNINPLSVAFLCHLTLKCFAMPVKYKSKIFGWNEKFLDEIIDSAFYRIGVRNEL